MILCSNDCRSEVQMGVRKIFDKTNIKDGKANCRVCSEWIATGGGTTNLRNHIRRKHPLHPVISEDKSSSPALQLKM